MMNYVECKSYEQTMSRIIGTFDNDMQQDAHEFLNHLLNTCADILTGLSLSFVDQLTR
jgi:ubiquitin C-terminal hydrolase